VYSLYYYPALNDLLPWTAPGVKPNRNWIYAPDQPTLRERLKTVIAESDRPRKAEMFKETDTSHLETRTQPLGPDTEQHTDRPFASEKPSHAAKAVILRSGYRFLDRQWIIADRRLIDRSRPEL
jgi:hypothetical protein